MNADMLRPGHAFRIRTEDDYAVFADAADSAGLLWASDKSLKTYRPFSLLPIPRCPEGVVVYVDPDGIRWSSCIQRSGWTYHEVFELAAGTSFEPIPEDSFLAFLHASV